MGVTNYVQLLGHDETFGHSLRVTIYYVLLAVPIGQVAALAVALLMNLRLRGITVFRTLFFVPSVVTGVAMAVLWLQLFNDDYGLINHMLRPVLAWFHSRPPNWFGVDSTASARRRRATLGHPRVRAHGPVGRGRRDDHLSGRAQGHSRVAL